VVKTDSYQSKPTCKDLRKRRAEVAPDLGPRAGPVNVRLSRRELDAQATTAA
jgi:hypothetical protein